MPRRAKRVKVLVVGNGGRESAIIWKLFQSRRIGTIYATGNGGMYEDVVKVKISQTDSVALTEYAKENNIGLTICANDDLLAGSIVDDFRAEGLKIFGPTRVAAKIEWSKAWAKGLMKKYGIPTAEYETFSNPDEAYSYAMNMLKNNGAVVIKVDGLAQGKGVFICRKKTEVFLAINATMSEKVYGDAGAKVVVEEFLEGLEVSFHVMVDTNGNYKIFPVTQDHKREGNGDTGRNTGGMGVIGPVSIITPEEIKEVERTIIAPILAAMKAEGAPFSGCLYPGLIRTKDGFKVLEFNCRFGDPETQVYMTLLKSDLLDLLEACADGTLNQFEIEWENEFATCIAMASAGYPGKVTVKDMVIIGVERAKRLFGVNVFYAGARMIEGGYIVNSGGRVLYVVSAKPTLAESISSAYDAIGIIRFEGGWYRVDIGAKCLQNQEEG